MKHSKNKRSNCPISFSLEMLGDAWSLLIVRDMIFAGKSTFGEFLASDEGIARNILANRLLQLEQKGIIRKKPHPSDGRKDLYQLTEAGLDLIPILLDLSAWGAKHEPETAWVQEMLNTNNMDREQFIEWLRTSVRN